jgi:outer membrane protein assembly factor BamB/formylglycine-generating enzyme required for sulfatase activity
MIRCGWQAALCAGLTAAAALSVTLAPAATEAPAAAPAPEGAPFERVRVRIVDFGADYAWHFGIPFYRGLHTKQVARDVDVDGDGETADDSVAYLPFSLSEPFNPIEPWYDVTATNAVFYGGGAAFFGNRPEPRVPEGGINVDHELRDDFNWHGYNSDEPDNTLQLYAAWIWKKEDFRNGGNAHNVSFDGQSRMAVHISRYWNDFDQARFVVGQGGRLYLSQHTFRGHRKTHVLSPTETLWAPWNPQPPHDMAFAPEGADFGAQDFSSVDAVGWYVAKDSVTRGECWLKWYAFEVEATVRRPRRPSETLAMVEVRDGRALGKEVPPFWVSTTEVPYETWHRVYKWATSNQFCFEPGYVFDRDGDMGDMDAGGEHTAREPVTDVSWLDAVAWCNALSETEGKTPCYYEGAEGTRVLRKVRERADPARYEWRPEVHVRWDADGYRLPVPAELVAACDEADLTRAAAWAGEPAEEGIRPVASASPNAAGICGLAGNAWELCWDAVGDIALPAEEGEQVALGPGSGPAPLARTTGFRVVRSRTGERPPTPASESRGRRMTFGPLPAAPVPAGPMPRVAAEAPTLDMVALPGGSFPRVDEARVHVSPMLMARTEVTFAQWAQVYDSARRRGYGMDRDGDMGSMDWEPGGRAHSHNEPVTDIGWYDAIAWCNALSEMEGHTPCYYADPEKVRPYRRALPFRLRMYQGGKPDPEPPSPHLRMQDEVYVRWEADGYRLPTEAEWEYAYRAGSAEHYVLPWGDGPATDHAWYGPNSSRRTHPVGRKRANPFGLHDMAGNVYEYVWGGPHNYYRNRDPKGDWRQAAAHNVRGGSFRLTERYSYHMRPIQRDRVTASASYPEIGFRVVRCEAGTHPPEGELVRQEVVLDADADEFDSLQGCVFRANLMRTGRFEASGVPKLDGVKWRFETGGPVISSPVAVDGLVYVGSDDGRFYAVEEESGERAWHFDAGAPVRSSAAVHGGVVYVGDNGGYLHALHAQDGSEEWSFEVHRWGRHLQFPLANSPAPAHGAVFFCLDAVRAVDAATGGELWRYREGRGLSGLSSVALGRGLLLYGGDGAHIVAARLHTERTAWKYNNASDHFVCTPAISGDTAYATGTRGIAALDMETGEPRWEYREEQWPRDPLFSSPTVAGGMVYCGSEDGSLYALDAERGQRLWAFPTGGQVTSSPAAADGVVYFGSYDGHLYALEARSGEEIWRFSAGAPIGSSPWVGDGVVYFGCHDGFLYAVH